MRPLPSSANFRASLAHGYQLHAAKLNVQQDNVENFINTTLWEMFGSISTKYLKCDIICYYYACTQLWSIKYDINYACLFN